MREKTLKIKGMRVPGLFIWLHGFFQGRITKTATVDEETGWISSSYITSKRKLFNELSAKRVKKLEQELKAVRVESFNLMLKESELRKKLEKNFVEIDSECSDIDKKRTIRCQTVPLHTITSYGSSKEGNTPNIVIIFMHTKREVMRT